MTPADRLIVALDVDAPRAREVVDALDGLVSTFKVGPRLLCAPGGGGMRFALDLLSYHEVLLDCKLHDVPSVVEDAVAEVAEAGFQFVTVHARRSVMLAAARGAGGTGLRVLGVTVLTSTTSEDLADDGHSLQALSDMGDMSAVENLVALRAASAAEAGIGGVVCSAHDLGLLRRTQSLRGLTLVVPGVRLLDDEEEDQQRVGTPGAAVRDGADYLVVGRPIVGSSDPLAAALRYVSAMGEPR